MLNAVLKLITFRISFERSGKMQVTRPTGKNISPTITKFKYHVYQVYVNLN